MGTPIQNFAERYGNTLLKHSKCPVCGDQMYYWKHQEVMGQPPTPTCPTCGHGELVKKEQLMISERLLIANKQDAINRMKRNSIITDTKAWNYNFDNYNVYDHETSQAKHISKSWAKDIIDQKTLHAILTGPPGVGKTHLGFSIAQAVLKGSKYEMSVAVVSYRELLEQLKFGFNDKEAFKVMQGSVMNELKRIDVVVVDDLGAELGKITEPSNPTNYNLDVLTSLAEARLNKATIYTSNLNSDQILTLYGDRIYSRIVNGAFEEGKTNAFRFKVTEDKRRNPIKGGE